LIEVYEEDSIQQKEQLQTMNAPKLTFKDSLKHLNISQLTLISNAIHEILSEPIADMGAVEQRVLVNERLLNPLIQLFSLGLKKSFWKKPSLNLLIEKFLKNEELSSFVSSSNGMTSFYQEKLNFDKKTTEVSFRCLLMYSMDQKKLNLILETMFSFEILDQCYGETPLKLLKVQKFLTEQVSRFTNQIELNRL
jgi:hypothetical protein